MICEFGIWKAGGVVVALNPTYSERELEQALDSMRVERRDRADAVLRTRRAACRGAPGCDTSSPTSIKEYLPPLLRVLFTLVQGEEGRTSHRAAGRSTCGCRICCALTAAHRGPQMRPSPDDRAVILSSGGTTGTPKGVVGLHRHYVAAGLQLYEWTKSAKKPWDDVIMLPLPLFHVYGNVGVQPLAFVGPNPLSLVPNPRDLADLLKTIAQVKPAFFNGVPTLYTAILNHPDVRSGKSRTCAASSCASPAPRRSWRRPNGSSRRPPAPASSKATR